MLIISRLPCNDHTNAWNTILPHRTPHAALAKVIKADWLVIGAGYAGLAAARQLAHNRPDDSIALVEAGVCGENASKFVFDKSTMPMCLSPRLLVQRKRP